MKTEQRLDIFVNVIILIVFVSLIFGFNGDKIVNWLIPIGVSFILSGIAGDLLESITGDFFKKIHLSIRIGEKRFNVPLFVILAFILKKFLFG